MNGNKFLTSKVTYSFWHSPSCLKELLLFLTPSDETDLEEMHRSMCGRIPEEKMTSSLPPPSQRSYTLKFKWNIELETEWAKEKRDTNAFVTQLAGYRGSRACPFVLLLFFRGKAKPRSTPSQAAEPHSAGWGQESHLPWGPGPAGRSTSMLPGAPAKAHGAIQSLRRDAVSTLLGHDKALIRFMWFSLHINFKYRN